MFFNVFECYFGLTGEGVKSLISVKYGVGGACLRWVQPVFPMNRIISYINRGARFCFMRAFLCLAFAGLFLASGCVTSSPEDDYVSGILAEAMRSSAVGGATPVQAAPAPVSVTQASPVSIARPASVSIAPAVVVSAAPVSVVSVPSKPEVTESKGPEPVAAPVPVPLNPGVLPAALLPAGATSGSAPVTGNVSKQPVPQPAIPTIQPDSVLWISVSEDPSLNGRYMVNDASAIDFGYVGLVFLPDMSIEQAEAEVKRVLEGRYLKNATVSVKLAKASYDRVGVQGSVEMPGDIKIGPGATISLSDALRRAGGIRGNRENCRVKIVRGGLKTPFGPAAEGEVSSLVTQDGQLKVPDVFLRNDDLIYLFTPSSDAAQGVPGNAGSTGAGGKRVVLLGEVPRRGVIEFSESEPCTLMYLLFKIGGLPRFAKADQITVVRRNKDGSEKSFLIDGDKLMNNGKPEDDLVLETGDRIVVPARKISFF
jgi:protein involved in polysaccharide export with SLBB domain